MIQVALLCGLESCALTGCSAW